MADYHPAVEQYLETIFELEESGIPPMRARLVERLGVSAPSVSETVARLEREGHVTLDPSRVIRLTGTGRSLATSIMRRHRLAERLLVDVLGVPWHQVHEEAGRLEHAISANLEAHLVQRLGDPATCPHGNPIPGSANAVDIGPTMPLADVPPGARAVVRRIDEEIEARADYMLLLERSGLTPDSTVQVVGPVGSGADELRLRSGTGEARVPDQVATKVFVTLSPAG
ncbi:MAG: metal-dependent transcriptional regulator [Mycobacteriales bacterium]